MTTLSLPSLTQPATAAQWNDFLLATATKLGLPASDWEPGAPTRTTFAVFSNALMIEDVDASLIAQAGFLDYAASGSVTYVDTDGNTVTVLVTPDPSIPAQNPTGALGALDVLADAVYDVQRILRTNAAGTLAILNTSVSTFTYQAGTYHVAQPGKTGTPSYSNVSVMTVAPSTLVGSVSGTASGTGGVVRLTVSSHGLTTGDVVFVANVGGTTEANGAWSVTVVDTNNFELVGSAYANAYTSGGKAYLPTLAAFIADNAGSGSSADIGKVTQAVTSIIGLSVSNPAAWVGTDTESNASVARRCRLKLGLLSPNGTASAYESIALNAQEYCDKIGLTGRPAQAITRAKSVADKTTGTVTTTIANASGGVLGGPYPTVGSDDGSDVWAVGAAVEAYAVPLGTTSIVQGASNHGVTVAMTIWVPTGSVSATAPIALAAVQAYFKTAPIGGFTDMGGSSNILPIEGVRAAVEVALKASSINVQDLTCTLNGSASNVTLGATEVAVPTVSLVSFDVRVV